LKTTGNCNIIVYIKSDPLAEAASVSVPKRREQNESGID
jgi:hypothetical protein